MFAVSASNLWPPKKRVTPKLNHDGQTEISQTRKRKECSQEMGSSVVEPGNEKPFELLECKIEDTFQPERSRGRWAGANSGGLYKP